MTIDPEKLADAIKLAELCWSEESRRGLVLAAARAHLATLPRYKEVEVESWATFFHDGTICSSGMTEKAAREDAKTAPDCRVVVRLTGTAKVKVTP